MGILNKQLVGAQIQAYIGDTDEIKAKRCLTDRINA